MMGRMDVSRTGICGTCWETGKDPKKRTRKCPDCEGTGKRWVCDTCKEAMPCSGTEKGVFDQTHCTKLTVPTPTHHCDFCTTDIVPLDIEHADGTPGDGERCPHCGASSNDYQHEFGINEPWVKPLEKT